MKSRDERFLAALAADAAGRQKQIAAEAFPATRLAVGETEVSNILAGRRRITAAFLLETMGDPDRTEALRFLAELAGYDLVRRREASVEEQLDEAIAQQTEILAKTASIADELREIAEKVRRAPHRAPAPIDRRKSA